MFNDDYFDMSAPRAKQTVPIDRVIARLDELEAAGFAGHSRLRYDRNREAKRRWKTRGNPSEQQRDKDGIFQLHIDENVHSFVIGAAWRRTFPRLR